MSHNSTENSNGLWDDDGELTGSDGSLGEGDEEVASFSDERGTDAQTSEDGEEGEYDVDEEEENESSWSPHWIDDPKEKKESGEVLLAGSELSALEEAEREEEEECEEMEDKGQEEEDGDDDDSGVEQPSHTSLISNSPFGTSALPPLSAPSWPPPASTGTAAPSAFTSFFAKTPVGSVPPAAGATLPSPFQSSTPLGHHSVHAEVSVSPLPTAPTAKQLKAPQPQFNFSPAASPGPVERCISGTAASLAVPKDCPLQFTSFVRTLGGKRPSPSSADYHRPLSEAEEAAQVRAILSRYELVIPTDKFDEQITMALYGA